MSPDLSAERLVPLLRGRFGRPYRYEPIVESTQRLLAADAPEGALVVTDEQTQGRGRLGRRWEAPARTSLLFSLALRPRVPGDRLPELSLVAGGAVAEAIADATALDVEVKFPNDVLVGGRKVAGILAEAREGLVVLGIGVNVNQRSDELPAATHLPPTSLRLAAGRELDRATLLVEILARLETAYDDWNRA